MLKHPAQEKMNIASGNFPLSSQKRINQHRIFNNAIVRIVFILFFSWTQGCQKDKVEIKQNFPNAPSNLDADMLSGRHVVLTWQDNSTDEEGFILERKMNTGAFEFLMKVDSNKTIQLDTNIAENFLYTYRIASYNKNGNSNRFSNEAKIRIPESLQTRLKRGLLIHLAFSGNAADSSGNKNDGQISGATLTSDRINQPQSAYLFNTKNAGFGTLKDQIYVPNSTTFNSDSLSVALWVNPSEYFWSGNPSDQSSTLINRFEGGYSNPNSQVWGIQMNNKTIEGFILNASSANNQSNEIVKTATVPLNTWTHLCMTFDGTTLKIYLDGVVKNKTISTIKINTASISGISIGQSRQANGHWYNFSGKLDDIRFWNRGISEEEIAFLAGK